MSKITIYRRGLHLKCDRIHCNSKCAVFVEFGIGKELIIVIG